MKASQQITHRKQLREPAATLPIFFERARLLGDRLGPILFQTPPWVKRDDESPRDVPRGTAARRAMRSRGTRPVVVRAGGLRPAAYRERAARPRRGEKRRHPSRRSARPRTSLMCGCGVRAATRTMRSTRGPSASARTCRRARTCTRTSGTTRTDRTPSPPSVSDARSLDRRRHRRRAGLHRFGADRAAPRGRATRRDGRDRGRPRGARPVFPMGPVRRDRTATRARADRAGRASVARHRSHRRGRRLLAVGDRDPRRHYDWFSRSIRITSSFARAVRIVRHPGTQPRPHFAGACLATGNLLDRRHMLSRSRLLHPPLAPRSASPRPLRRGVRGVRATSAYARAAHDRPLTEGAREGRDELDRDHRRDGRLHCARSLGFRALESAGRRSGSAPLVARRPMLYVITQWVRS